MHHFKIPLLLLSSLLWIVSGTEASIPFAFEAAALLAASPRSHQVACLRSSDLTPWPPSCNFKDKGYKLAIVIDDIGYRPVNENKILQLPLPISIAILPHAPYARSMAIKAHNQGREILIWHKRYKLI